MGELRKILRLTAGVGEELIRCGAEISRVEDTMNRIALHYGVTGRQIFIISNGVFVNLEKGEEAKNVSFQHIPQISVDMSRLCELNSLSRDIEQKDLPLEQALARFEQIPGWRKEKYMAVCGGFWRGSGGILLSVWRRRKGLFWSVSDGTASVAFFYDSGAIRTPESGALYAGRNSGDFGMYFAAAYWCSGPFRQSNHGCDYSDDSRSGVCERDP